MVQGAIKRKGGIFLVRLLRFLKGYEKESIIGPLFKLFEACLELSVPLIMASIIDDGIKNNDTAYIVRMGGLLILMGFLGLVCSVIAQYFAAKAAFGFGTALRRKVFETINGFTYTELDKIGTSTLVNRTITDITQVQSGVNFGLRLFLRSPFIILGSLILSFLLDVQLALIFVAITPLLAIVIWALMRFTMPIYKRAQGQLDKLALLTRESLLGVRVIRAFSRQEQEIEHFSSENSTLRQTQLKGGSISALMNPLTYVLVNIGILLLLQQGAFAVNFGRISQGDLVALVNYMNQILLALVALSNLIVTVGKSFAGAVRINEILDTAPSFSSGNKEAFPKAGVPSVEFRDVSFGYGGNEVLSHISFSVLPGETIGIIGGTGAGKSTLVNLIPRFYAPTKGTILFHGLPLEQWDFTSLRRRMGIVPQKAVLFEGTIASNLRWKAPNASDEQLWKALDIAQASDFVKKLEHHLESDVLKGGSNFSGGQRQRLSIARALSGPSDLLILDDSTSALDYATDAKLRQALQKEKQPLQTILLVSQRVACVRNANRILVLDDGKLVGFGTHKQLLEQCPVYREICLSQLSKEEVEQG